MKELIQFISKDRGKVAYIERSQLPTPLPPIYLIPVPSELNTSMVDSADDPSTMRTVLVGEFRLGMNGTGQPAYWLERTVRK